MAAGAGDPHDGTAAPRMLWSRRVSVRTCSGAGGHRRRLHGEADDTTTRLHPRGRVGVALALLLVVALAPAAASARTSGGPDHSSDHNDTGTTTEPRHEAPEARDEAQRQKLNKIDRLLKSVDADDALDHLAALQSIADAYGAPERRAHRATTGRQTTSPTSSRTPATRIWRAPPATGTTRATTSRVTRSTTSARKRSRSTSM